MHFKGLCKDAKSCAHTANSVQNVEIVQPRPPRSTLGQPSPARPARPAKSGSGGRGSQIKQFDKEFNRKTVRFGRLPRIRISSEPAGRSQTRQPSQPQRAPDRIICMNSTPRASQEQPEDNFISIFTGRGIESGQTAADWRSQHARSTVKTTQI